MRTNELLEALAQARGGVQINVCRTGVTVATRYTPLTKGRGANIFAAARACASNLRSRVRPGNCPEVLRALDAYDRHTGVLQA